MEPAFFQFSASSPDLYLSKSEIILADLLNRNGIPYRYEYPVHLKGWGKVYPDFTLLDVRKRREIYWEHFGMMDDSEYAEKAIQNYLTNYPEVNPEQIYEK